MPTYNALDTAKLALILRTAGYTGSYGLRTTLFSGTTPGPSQITQINLTDNDNLIAGIPFPLGILNISYDSLHIQLWPVISTKTGQYAGANVFDKTLPLTDIVSIVNGLQANIWNGHLLDASTGYGTNILSKTAAYGYQWRFWFSINQFGSLFTAAAYIDDESHPVGQQSWTTWNGMSTGGVVGYGFGVNVTDDYQIGSNATPIPAGDHNLIVKYIYSGYLVYTSTLTVTIDQPAPITQSIILAPSTAPVQIINTVINTSVDGAIQNCATRYNLPLWWLYAIIARESYFNPNEYNPNGGYGLTQLTGVWYVGTPYPEGLTAPDNNNRQYGYDMNFAQFGPWLQMTQVSRLDNPFDPTQNLDRFATGYAVPLFNKFKNLYNESDTDIFRRMAFHWNKGLYTTYDPNNADYLSLYDQYVATYKPQVETKAGIWNGAPHY